MMQTKKQNFERYKTVTTDTYDTKGLSYLLWRKPSDRVLLPYIENLRNQRICEVGLGTGYYTRFLLEQGNHVVGVDQNPHLCRLDVEMIRGDATEISRLCSPADVVFAAWLTEYLSPQSLFTFFQESYTLLSQGGTLVVTVISPHGWGWMYITLARVVRKIQKFFYPKREVRKMLEDIGFDHVEIVDLHSWCFVPWAYLVIAKRSSLSESSSYARPNIL